MIIGIILVVQKISAYRRIGPEDFTEALEIRAHHTDVNIIIPGNKTLMSDCAYHGPARAVIGYIMLHAYGVDFF